MCLLFFKLQMFMAYHSCGNARGNDRRRMKFIGLTRTGISLAMTTQIAQAVGQLPAHWEVHEAEVLEIQQVSLWALHFNHAVGTAMTLQ